MTSTAVIIGCIDRTLPTSDRAAATIAVARFGNDVVACSPYGDEAALRFAIGAGAREVVPLQECRAAVYLIGRGGAGTDGDLMAARLATARRATFVVDVLDVEPRSDSLIVRRDLGRGAREVVTLNGPAVLLIADDAPQPIYVSRYRQLKAQLPRIDPAPPPPPAAWEPVRLRTKTADLVSKTGGSAQMRMFAAFGLGDDADANNAHIITADAETCADHLVRYLAHHGFVKRRLAPTETTRPTKTSVVDARAESHVAWNTVHIRVPRPIGSSPPGLQRHPRPYRPISRNLGKWARSPRPLGHTQPFRLRGPFPVAGRELDQWGT